GEDVTITCRARLEGRRRCSQVRLVVDFDADDAMWADHGSLAALDAHVRGPHGYVLGEVALFPLGCAGGVGAINWESTGGERIAQAGDHLRRHLLDKGWSVCCHRQREDALARHALWHAHLVQLLQRLVDSAKIPRNDLLAAFPIGFLDGSLDGLVVWQHP